MLRYTIFSLIQQIVDSKYSVRDLFQLYCSVYLILFYFVSYFQQKSQSNQFIVSSSMFLSSIVYKPRLIMKNNKINLPCNLYHEIRTIGSLFLDWEFFSLDLKPKHLLISLLRLQNNGGYRHEKQHIRNDYNNVSQRICLGSKRRVAKHLGSTQDEREKLFEVVSIGAHIIKGREKVSHIQGNRPKEWDSKFSPQDEKDYGDVLTMEFNGARDK